MTNARGADGELLPDSERLTPIGRLMRSYSVDELPQLINILKGEMSFVGPRPQVVDFLAAMTEHEKRRHDVRPGLTGWSQINGRNAVSWRDRFEEDIWYVENASFGLDMRILALTPRVVFTGKGVQADDHATMPTLHEERAVEAATDRITRRMAG